MTEQKKPWVPPRWVVTTAWSIHRNLYRLTGGRFGLRQPKPGTYGMMQVTTIGRRSGHPREVILGYIEDGPNLVTMAMNGWAEADPAWWLNVQTNPHAAVKVPGGERKVVGRAATGTERDRLWNVWRELDADLDGYAALRSTETAVVVFEPAPTS